MKIAALHLSPGHNFFGHHGKPPGEHEILSVERVECVAGAGLRGDRFFNYKDNYAGQITFFAEEIHHRLLCDLPPPEPRAPASYRRNVLTRGVDLNSLIGKEFTLQGVRFAGAAECKPCYWMDRAIAPGSENFLKGNGGLRARILRDGELRVDCPTAAGLLLAGGRSSRMGRDKGTLQWNGRTMREHQAATMATTGAWPLFFSCRAEQRETPARFARIEDAASDGAGALGAFVGALRRIAREVVAVLAIDLPRMSPAVLSEITGRARDEGSSVVPRVNGRFEPFAAAWHQSAFEELHRAAASGRALQTVCADLEASGKLIAHEVDNEVAAAFANANTPEEWHAL